VTDWAEVEKAVDSVAAEGSDRRCLGRCRRNRRSHRSTSTPCRRCPHARGRRTAPCCCTGSCEATAPHRVRVVFTRANVRISSSQHRSAEKETSLVNHVEGRGPSQHSQVVDRRQLPELRREGAGQEVGAKAPATRDAPPALSTTPAGSCLSRDQVFGRNATHSHSIAVKSPSCVGMVPVIALSNRNLRARDPPPNLSKNIGAVRETDSW
jgi:hypothetical protein